MLPIPVLKYKLLILLLITAERQLIHDRTASRTEWDTEYDFIVVGAGTAGCVVANRLTEDNDINVLLLEAGGPQNAVYHDIPYMSNFIYKDRPDLQWQNYNEAPVIGGKNTKKAIWEPTGKSIGGSSSHNGKLFNRGNRRDYDIWSNKYGAKGWSYSKVLPFFKKFENNTDLSLVEANPGYHGTGGPIEVRTQLLRPKALQLLEKAYKELGFETTDINGPKQRGMAYLQLYIGMDGFRSSSGNGYVDPNPHPNNLHIVTKALVVRILFNGLTAIGVEFSKNDIQYKVYARKEVILSAGAINTPKLLMLSGIGIKSHLSEFGIPVLIELPVGNNFFNHPGMNIKSKLTDPDLYWPYPTFNIASLSQLYFEGSGLLTEKPQLALYFNTSDRVDMEWPDGFLCTVAEGDSLRMSFNYNRPRSVGKIRLQSSDPYSSPRIDSAFLKDPMDFEDAVNGLEFIFNVLETTSMAKFVTPPTFESVGCASCPGKLNYQCKEGLKCYIQKMVSTTFHPVGGCRMGDRDRDDVVVGPLLRVKYTKNLRVCDNSVIPHIPNANTNAVAYMIGEKCSQIIKDYYKNK